MRSLSRGGFATARVRECDPPSKQALIHGPTERGFMCSSMVASHRLPGLRRPLAWRGQAQWKLCQCVGPVTTLQHSHFSKGRTGATGTLGHKSSHQNGTRLPVPSGRPICVRQGVEASPCWHEPDGWRRRAGVCWKPTLDWAQQWPKDCQRQAPASPSAGDPVLGRIHHQPEARPRGGGDGVGQKR